MFKRLLAFVLAGALIVETPATAYAAEQIPVTEQDSTEGLEEESDDTAPEQETSIEESRDSETTGKNEVGGGDKSSNNDVLSGAVNAEVQEVEESEADIDFDLTTDATLGTLSGTSAVIAGDFSKLTLNATVTGYTGAETKAYLYYEYTNALGEIVKGIGAAAEGTQTDDTKTFELSAVNEKPALLANEEYDVKVCVVFADDAPYPEDVTIDDTMLNETVTATAGDVAVSYMEFATFTVAQNASGENIVDYTISGVQTADDQSPVTTTDAAIYYREEPNGKFNKSDVVITKGASTGTIIALVPGKSYYFVLMVRGAKKEANLKLSGENVEIILSKSEESGDNNSVGTYDVIRTIKAEATSGNLAEAYILEMWYKRTSDDESTIAKLGSETLDSENGYKAEMNSAEWTVLMPDTSYDFEYRLMPADAYAAPGAITTLRENVKTNAATFTVTKNEDDSSHNSHGMGIKLTAAEVTNLKANDKKITLYASLKKSSETYIAYPVTNEIVEFNKANDYTATLTFTGLESETEYSLVLRNADGEDVLSDDTKLTFTTDAEPEDTREVKDISVTPTSSGATIEYTTVSDVSGGYVLCYVRKVSAEGEAEEPWTRKGYNYCYSGTENGNFSISGLSPETEYEYLIGFGSSYNAEDLVNTVTAKFTTPADTRKATVVSTSTKVTVASFDVTVSDVDDDCYVQVNYRKHVDTGEAEPWKFGDITYYKAASSKRTVTISDLTPNTKYDYQVGVKEYYDEDTEGLINPTEVKDFTTKEDNRTITATAKATVTSVVIDYTVGGLLSEDDKLEFYYREKDSETWLDLGETYYIGEQIKLINLTAGKTYEFVLGFGGWGSTAAEIKAHAGSAGAEFSLATEDRKIASTETAKVTSVVINYTVSGTIDEDDSVIGYFREAKSGQSAEENWKSMNYYHNSNSKSFTMSGLPAGTDYEYVLGFSDWGSTGSELIDSGKTEKKQFSTLADDRKITASPTAKITEAVINCTVSGAVSEDDTVIGFYKLKDSEDTWHPISSEYEADYAFEMYGLTPNTNYTYVIGFSDWGANGDALAASDKSTAKGDFKTTADNRKAEVASVESRVTRAVVNYTLSGDYSESDSLMIYYKKDGEEDWYLSRKIYDVNSMVCTLSELKPETKYNYKIGFGTNVDELTGSSTGDFTTLADQRTLSNPSAEVITTGTFPEVKISLLFSGNIDFQKTYIHYFYKDKAETSAEWTWASYRQTEFDVMRNFSQSISGMDWGKSYEYAVVISDSYSSPNPDAVKDSMKVKGEFEIPAKAAATAIKLSQDKIYLNAGSVAREGYLYQMLKASLTPSTADENLIWEVTGNPGVVMLFDGSDAYEEIVYATNAGSTAITVSVAGKPEIKATCEVEVADYRIYAEYNGEKEQLNQVSYYNKTKSVETYHLYKIENGAVTEVTDCKVTSDNASIVKWNDTEKKLEVGQATGIANLTFTAGNFKALLMVESLPQAQNIYVTDFEVSKSNFSYKAINNGDGFTLACGAGLSYRAVVDEEALYPFEDAPLQWSTVPGTQDIISVDPDSGVVTPLKKGDVTLKVTTTIKPNNVDKTLTAEVKLHIVDIPTVPNKEVYALANTAVKLSDVVCPEGWAWKYPDTPLVVNGNYDEECNYYYFEAVCNSGAYPRETTICVNMAKVTGMSADNYPDAIVEVGGTAGTEDSINLTINTDYQGQFYYNQKNNDYNGYEIFIPDVNNVTVTPTGVMDENGRQEFAIKAAKAGTYTIKPVIRAKDSKGNYKVLAKMTYKFKAVASTNAENIILELADGSKGIVTKDEGKYYIDLYSENEVGGVKPADSVTTFSVKAILKDRIDAKTPNINPSTTSASLTATKLTWKSSDAKVLKVAATSDNHVANVTVKGEGHAVLTATAKDAAGHSGTLNIEIRNHAPRVNSSKVTVNKAYDFTTDEGRELAYNSLGGIEIVPVYGEYIRKVRVYKGDAESSDLRAYTYSSEDSDDYGDKYVIAAKNSKAESGQYELRVTTNKGKTYKYPIKVTVVDKAPKVTIKSHNTVNLFNTSNYPEIAIKVSGTNVRIDSVTWKDKTAAVGDGFSTDWYEDDGYDNNSSYIFYGSTENIKLKNNKPESKDIAKGTFTVKLYGYRQACEVPATIKYSYKKPAIVSQNASTTLNPSIGKNSNYFKLYNKTEKYNISPDSYDITCQNKNVAISTGEYYVDYNYTGTKTSGTEKLELKVMSETWREPVIVKHTIKLAKPTVALTSPQLILNTNEIGTAYTDVYTKNAGDYIDCDNIVIEGKDAKSIKLLADGQLEIARKDYNNRIAVTQKRAEKAITPGTYSYKITPYYKDAEGNSKPLKTLVLKVKVVNKAVTAKVKTKNTLDLLKGAYDYGYISYSNYIVLTSTFTNLGSGYSIDKIKLVGEYSNYFEYHDYAYDYNYQSYYGGNGELYISDIGIGNLKAGQKYKLALEYTITMPFGDTFTVTSAAFTVTPKQSVPKVTVHNNNQTLYVGAGAGWEDELCRTYKLSTAGYKYKNGNTTDTAYYTISRIYGGLDCNKDGEADIHVYGYGSYDDNGCGYASVYMENPDAVLTTTGAKGKTYSIPVTVTLEGRDGISKDVKTTIKVTIKR
ncbi:MAG: hypothetical protein K2K46_05470 [Lachnospiraceae bacterium]|nr:hypothetical protein [Lachnospiraceae bacterium]